ncbi:hypothetical protein [Mycobacterium marinum]|uniref:hypothetical protein n=1 Tax=Mycobacterium marinum TaxID=1781 RepID=UPI00235A3132|nr:hypothetical protein [Mycobacterium marinum]MDC8985527.1 hypothetical protein [Mycobacterium marinum]MDC9002829.1 hypothetical protein [Mycobacterium marinum]MDC9013564.1 hypothetical protein [Mycobacterium marinum]MDC9018914.1 hypothetical protein [Mycobacterium marinum]
MSGVVHHRAGLVSLLAPSRGECFDGASQVSDFGGKTGAGAGVGLPGAMFIDDGRVVGTRGMVSRG